MLSGEIFSEVSWQVPISYHSAFDDAGDCVLHGLESWRDKDQTLCWWGDLCATPRECAGLWCLLGATNMPSCKWESDGAIDNDWCLPPSFCQDHHCCHSLLWLCKSWPQSEIFIWVDICSNKQRTILQACSASYLYELEVYSWYAEGLEDFFLGPDAGCHASIQTQVFWVFPASDIPIKEN